MGYKNVDMRCITLENVDYFVKMKHKIKNIKILSLPKLFRFLTLSAVVSYSIICKVKNHFVLDFLKDINIS
jgi:hypothetical protein